MESEIRADINAALNVGAGEGAEWREWMPHKLLGEFDSIENWIHGHDSREIISAYLQSGREARGFLKPSALSNILTRYVTGDLDAEHAQRAVRIMRDIYTKVLKDNYNFSCTTCGV